MKRILWLILVCCILLFPMSAYSSSDDMISIQIIAGDRTFSAKLYCTQTTESFIKQMPFTITMKELNGNEKFYYLSDALPTASYQPEEIKAGDLMLYGTDCLVLFYESFSTPYSYTGLGFIEDSSGLSDALGDGSISVTFTQNQGGTNGC